MHTLYHDDILFISTCFSKVFARSLPLVPLSPFPSLLYSSSSPSLFFFRWSLSCPLAVWTLTSPHRRPSNGPLTRYVKLRVAHAPGIPRTFSPPLTSKESASWRSPHASQHVRGACAVMHVGIANPRWWGKLSRHSRRMRNPQFYLIWQGAHARRVSMGFPPHFSPHDSVHKAWLDLLRPRLWGR